MKKIISILISILILFLPLLVFSQSNFEGIITYRAHETGEAATFDINMYYGKNKLKMFISGQSKLDYPNDAEKIMQFDFEKGLCYTIDTIAKTIEIDSLKFADLEDVGIDFLPIDSFKVIQGHNCRLYKPKKPEDISADLFDSKNDLSIWFAEDVKYIIPKEYINKRSLIATDDGNTIWVKFTFILGMSYQDKKVTDTFTSEMIRIEKQALTDDIFNLPSNYIFSKKTRIIRDEEAEIDSARVKELTLTELKQEESKKEPPPPPPPKKTPPSKSPAKKEKSKPVKG